MAQFFKGNYGSALARVDTRPILEAGRAQGAMYQNMGNQISGAIQQYGLNKQERAKLTGEIEQDIMQYGDRLTMSGNEESDKKNFSAVEKFRRGDSSMADLRGLSGQIARMKLNDAEQQRTQANELMNEMRREKLLSDKRLREGVTEGYSELIGVAEQAIKARKDADQAGVPFIMEPEVERLVANIPQLKASLRSGDPSLLSQFTSDPQADQLRSLQITDLEKRIEREPEKFDQEKRGREALIQMREAQKALLEKQVDPSIPQNVDTNKQLKSLRSDISALRKKQSFTKNDDDEFLTLQDLVEFDPNTGKATISDNASRRDHVALKELIKLVENEYATSLDQIITHTFKNGRTVKARMGDIMRLLKEEEDEELRKKAEADEKLRNLRNTQGSMRMDYDYSNLDPSIAEMMVGSG